MTVSEVIELLLNRMNTTGAGASLAFSAFGGTTGNINLLQREANDAIKLWYAKQDASGLHQLAATLQAYGNLTDIEYEQIMETIDGEK